MPAFSGRHLFPRWTLRTPPLRNRRRQGPSVIALTLLAGMDGLNRLILTRQTVIVISAALLRGLPELNATSPEPVIFSRFDTNIVQITVVPTIAKPTNFPSAAREHHRHQIVLAMPRTPTANVCCGAVFMIGIAAIAEMVHFLRTSISIREPAVRPMRQNRATVIAACVARQITIVLILSTVIGTITCAIATTTARQDDLAVAVMPTTPPAQPTSVVPVVAIPFVKYVCPRQHQHQRLTNHRDVPANLVRRAGAGGGNSACAASATAPS